MRSGLSWSGGFGAASHRAARRARIVLLAAEGLSNSAIAEKLGVSRLTVGTWRRRFADRRFCGLDDEPRPGAPRKIGDDKVAEVVTRTLETVPEDATHWSRRSMARATGLSATTVHRIWRAFGLQPHRVETFKLSSDPLFVDKVRNIVGGSIRNFVLWAIVMKKKGASYGNREGTIGPAVGGA